MTTIGFFWRNVLGNSRPKTTTPTVELFYQAGELGVVSGWFRVARRFYVEYLSIMMRVMRGSNCFCFACDDVHMWTTNRAAGNEKTPHIAAIQASKPQTHSLPINAESHPPSGHTRLAKESEIISRIGLFVLSIVSYRFREMCARLLLLIASMCGSRRVMCVNQQNN